MAEREKKKVEEQWGMDNELDMNPDKPDNPENMRGEKGESIYDMHEDMQTVDAIPVEDQKQEQLEEARPRMTKHDSSTPQKFPGGEYMNDREEMDEEEK
ncbi:hypothetical protein [Bhargavaea cecembensis]|uniref:hypothetical protein n=1 Tax=Bhargavaea cecembensis TaxID=394098 RepID=UPI00058E4056|nr:hypothetical protein [Bhargavaea cecembensis]